MTYDPSSYDPTNAPEIKRRFVGRVTASKLTTIPVEYNAEAAARSRPDDWWALEVDRLDAVFEDGTVPGGTFNGNGTLWRNDAGEPYGKGSAPNIIAIAFGDIGFACWPGNPRSQELVGQVFMFEGARVKLGKREKYLNLPVAHLGGADYQFTGEKQILQTKRNGAGDGQIASAVVVDDATTETRLVETLTGKTPSQVFDTILGDATLKVTPTFKGVNLVGAAADGSLLQYLPMSVGAEGTLQPSTPQEVTA